MRTRGIDIFDWSKDVHFGVRLRVANHDEFPALEMISVETFLESLPGCPVSLKAELKDRRDKDPRPEQLKEPRPDPYRYHRGPN